MHVAATLQSHLNTFLVTHSKTSVVVSLQDLQLETACALLGQGQVAFENINSVGYLQRLIDGLCELSLKDPLTGLANRRQLFTAIDRELDRVARSGETALLLMLDIDHFKQINDCHGHSAGDQVLQAVARVLIDCVRPMDSLVRFGGEEFAIILPACHAVFGKSIAERIRSAVEAVQVPISPTERLQVTVSVGGAFALQWIRSTGQLWLERADQQLYRSKSHGRNCVHIEEQPDSTVSAEEKSLLFSPLGQSPSTWVDVSEGMAAWNATDESIGTVN